MPYITTAAAKVIRDFKKLLLRDITPPFANWLLMDKEHSYWNLNKESHSFGPASATHDSLQENESREILLHVINAVGQKNLRKRQYKKGRGQEIKKGARVVS